MGQRFEWYSVSKWVREENAVLHITEYSQYRVNNQMNEHMYEECVAVNIWEKNAKVRGEWSNKHK